MAGCSFFQNARRDGDAHGKRASNVDEARAQYRLDVEAPGPLDRLLENNLDLARFRDVPSSEGLNEAELDRLIGMAPEQARALLATEGYFSAEVRVTREPARDGGLPRVLVKVEPGPRTQVDSVNLNVQGELRQRADRDEADARALLERLRTEWPLKTGEPFRQADWTAAKTGTLGRLHAGGYPAATWIATDARVRSKDQRVDLEATAESGPLFHLGELRIEGVRRYDAQVVRDLAGFSTGTPYSERRLLDFQERLQRSSLFEGAVVEIDPDPEKASATPVTVRVQEQRLQQVTLGLGYRTDTGTRASVEHIHRKPFGLRWTARNNLELGPRRKAWEFDYRSYPKPGFKRNLVAGEVERWRGPAEERDALRLRAGRAWEDPRLERQVYAELNNTRVREPLGTFRKAQSITGHYDWTRRNVDSLLLPTRGQAIQLQAAAGHSRSSTAESGPLARAYGRVISYHPLTKPWQATLRLEAGQVFARDNVGVPDTLLFRAGGEESVRGYAYRSLGPVVNGAVTSGRSLLTASAEVARPITPRFPQILGAAFIDAGNAAQNFGDLRPVVGIGVGVRYRSPVGPLKVDVAYGVDNRTVRLHLSAGTAF